MAPPRKKATKKSKPAASVAAGGTLAEALILRADYQKRIEQLRARINRNAKVQEGEKPAEDPSALIAEVERVTDDLLRIIQRINLTNATTTIARGMTISDAIAHRDVLRIKHQTYRDAAQAGTITQDVRTKSEVRFKSAVPVSALQKKADDCARQHRELDARIQEANWRTALA